MNSKTIKKSIILRNESFGGVFFNQENGKMAMIDHEGFETIVGYNHKRPLTKRQTEFLKFFFKIESPSTIQLWFKPSVKNKLNTPLVTSTPILLNIALNNFCNLNCPYCYNEITKSSIEEKQQISMENFDLLLRKMTESRILQVALGGGEPTLHPNFVEILRKLRVEGNIIPNYTTNGIFLNETILKASKKYCGAVAVSYNQQREEALVKTVQKLLECRIQTHLNLIMFKSKIHSLSHVIKKFAMMGVSNFILLLFKPIGKGLQLQDETLTFNDIKSINKEILKLLVLSKKHGFTISIDACSSFIFKDFHFLPQTIGGCTSTLYSAFIDSNLEMKPCSFMQNMKGVDLKQNNIQNAWNSPLFVKFRKILLNPRNLKCNTCYFYSNCGGGCPLKPEIVFCKDSSTNHQKKIRKE